MSSLPVRKSSSSSGTAGALAGVARPDGAVVALVRLLYFQRLYERAAHAALNKCAGVVVFLVHAFGSMLRCKLPHFVRRHSKPSAHAWYRQILVDDLVRSFQE